MGLDNPQQVRDRPRYVIRAVLERDPDGGDELPRRAVEGARVLR